MIRTVFPKSTVFALIFLFAVACRNNKTANTNQNNVVATDTAVSDFLQDDYFSMPSPEEVLTFFNSRPLAYKPGIICQAKDLGRYEQYDQQLIMIGVYSSDLAYLTLHRRNDEVFSYYSAIQQLVEKVKIKTPIDQTTLNRVMENQHNLDSLVVISRQAYLKLIAYFLDYEMESQMIKMLYGSYIETLYLSNNYIESFDTDNDLIQKISDQKYTTDYLEILVSQYLNPKDNNDIIDGLSQLSHFFESLKVENTENADVKSAKSGQLVIGGNEIIVMDDTQFKELKTLVSGIRNKLIQ